MFLALSLSNIKSNNSESILKIKGHIENYAKVKVLKSLENFKYFFFTKNQKSMRLPSP